MPGFFAPDGANATSQRPTAQEPSVADGWCKDATAPGAGNGTVVTATLVNQIISNLRAIVTTYGGAEDGTDSMLVNALSGALLLKSVYDPGGAAADAFDMDNMVESVTSKVMSATERTKLGHITVAAPIDLGTVFDMDNMSEGATNLILTAAERAKLAYITVASAIDLGTVFDMANMVEAADAKVMTAAERTKLSYITVSSAINLANAMLKGTYDPTSVNGDAFDMANMAEATNAKVLTAAERTKIAAAITDLLNDTSPQLGGNLDTNANHIQFDSLYGIRDDSGNEQLMFQKIASAANYLLARNAAAGNAPLFSAAGSDTNIDLQISPKGTGTVNIEGLRPGHVFWYAGSSPPDYALQCDGSAISRSTYARLFGKISTTYGAGNGSTTFNIPNLTSANRFIRAAGGGLSVGATQNDGAPNISGVLAASTSRGILRSGSGLGAFTEGTTLTHGLADLQLVNNEEAANFNASSDDATYSDSVSEVRPTNIAMLPCIAY